MEGGVLVGMRRGAVGSAPLHRGGALELLNAALGLIHGSVEFGNQSLFSTIKC